MQHTVGVVRPVVEEPVNLGAQASARVRMVRVAAKLDGPLPLHGDGPGTGVRTVVRTGPAERLALVPHPGSAHLRSVARNAPFRIGAIRPIRVRQRRPAALRSRYESATAEEKRSGEASTTVTP